VKSSQSAGTPSIIAAPSSSAAPVELTDSANRTTVHAAVGQTVIVALAGGYWSTVTSSAPQLLQPVAAPEPLASASPTGFCPPGAGCGSRPAGFTAKAAGSAQLTASRHVCGEAMACAPDQRTFTVTVEITG
jgi:hypothetical protein